MFNCNCLRTSPTGHHWENCPAFDTETMDTSEQWQKEPIHTKGFELTLTAGGIPKEAYLTNEQVDHAIKRLLSSDGGADIDSGRLAADVATEIAYRQGYIDGQRKTSEFYSRLGYSDSNLYRQKVHRIFKGPLTPEREQEQADKEQDRLDRS